MTEKIMETRTHMVENVRLLDYSDYERRLQYIEFRERIDRLDYMELRYNHNHDEKGRFCSGGGGGRMSSSEKKLYSNGGANPEKSVDKSEESDIIEEISKQSLLKKKVDSGELPITINAEKQARHVLIGDETSKPDGRSYLTIDITEAQNIINTYYAKGEVIYIPKSNKFKEFITADKIIGVDGRSNQETNQAFINYSKTGTHLVSTKKGRYEK